MVWEVGREKGIFPLSTPLPSRQEAGPVLLCSHPWGWLTYSLYVQSQLYCVAQVRCRACSQVLQQVRGSVSSPTLMTSGPAICGKGQEWQRHYASLLFTCNQKAGKIVGPAPPAWLHCVCMFGVGGVPHGTGLVVRHSWLLAWALCKEYLSWALLLSGA